MNVGMDWIALRDNELWREFWASPLVLGKIDGLESALLTGRETDPQAIGRMRGALESLRWAQEIVKMQAKGQAAEPEPEPQKATAAVAWYRRQTPKVR